MFTETDTPTDNVTKKTPSPETPGEQATWNIGKGETPPRSDEQYVPVPPAEPDADNQGGESDTEEYQR